MYDVFCAICNSMQVVSLCKCHVNTEYIRSMKTVNSSCMNVRKLRYLGTQH
jgi:hypothetical protein